MVVDRRQSVSGYPAASFLLFFPLTLTKDCFNVLTT